jgi:death-on-curing protein
MSDPIWVPLAAVYVIHDRQIARHGGASGLRDKTLLEAAVVRPENKFSYELADMFACAAAYAFGIAKAHAFVDGNKRTAFVTAVTFLRLNGYQFTTNPTDGLRFMEGIATGEVTELQFASWLKAGSHEL